MENSNAETLFASLSEEMQEKVKACRTVEELQTLVNANPAELGVFAKHQEDIVELSGDELEGVVGGRGGFAPLALAALMTFTAMGATMAGTSGKNAMTSYVQKNDVQNTNAPDAEDMNRNDITEDVAVNSIQTKYNRAGDYSVSFSGSDLVFAKDAKNAAADVLDAIDPDFTLAMVTKDDIKVQYAVKTAAADESAEPVYEKRELAVTAFSANGDKFSVSFTDPDAAENKTGSYILYIEKLGAVAMVSVKFEDHTLSCDTERISSTSESNTITLTTAEGSFSEEISAEDIQLGGSFKDMRVDSVRADGSQLHITLSGSPVLDLEDCSTYRAGIITVNENGFVNGDAPCSAYIDVEAPGAFVDVNGMGWENGQFVVPIRLSGILAEDISAEDVKLEGTIVREVKAAPDNIIYAYLDMDLPAGSSCREAADFLSGKNMTVGSVETVCNIAHASFYPFFDYIGQNGDELTLTVKLQVSCGTVADGINESMIALSSDFAGGRVERITKNSDTEATLEICIPANGMTDEEYSITGGITLTEGALMDTWGEIAPECFYTRHFNPDELNRISVDTAFDYSITGLGYISKDAQKVAKFGKGVYDLYQKAVSLDISGTVSGVKSLLTMVGILDEPKSASDQMASDIKEIKQEVQKMNDMLITMNGKLDSTLKALYDTYMQGFDGPLNDMVSFSNDVQQMMAFAMTDLDTLGLTKPADDATDDELAQFEKDLIDAIIEQDKMGNRDYDNFEFKMQQVELNYINVTNQLINNTEDHNPIYYYDQIWTLYFNFDSQGYYLRQGYRTKVEFAIKNAYDLLAVRYNLSAKPTRAKILTENLTNSLEELEKHPAGLSPEEVHANYMNKAYSYTLKKNIYSLWEGAKNGDYPDGFSDEMAKEYVSRLHGNTVKQDIELSGLMYEKSWLSSTEGICIRCARSVGDGTGDTKTKLLHWLSFDFRYVSEDTYWSETIFWDGTQKPIMTWDTGDRNIRRYVAYINFD